MAVALFHGGAALDGVLGLLDGELRLVDGHITRLLDARQDGVEIALGGGAGAGLGACLGLPGILPGGVLGLARAGAADDDGGLALPVVDDHGAAVGALNAGLPALGGDGGAVLLGLHAQIGQQLVHVAQILHGAGEGGLVVQARAGHVQKAVVQVVGQLLHQLLLLGGLGGGGQPGGHRIHKSALDVFHCSVLLC